MRHSCCSCYQARGGRSQLAGAMCDGARLCESGTCCWAETYNSRAVTLPHKVCVQWCIQHIHSRRAGRAHMCTKYALNRRAVSLLNVFVLRANIRNCDMQYSCVFGSAESAVAVESCPTMLMSCFRDGASDPFETRSNFLISQLLGYTVHRPQKMALPWLL